MKTSLVTVGVDDGFFPQKFKELKLKTVLAGVLCVGKTPKSVKIVTVTVDGDDGTSKTRALVESLKKDNAEAIDVVFLDGVTIAGFNYVNPLELHSNLHTPVVVIFKTKLKLDKVKRALMNHFTDWMDRFNLIEDSYTRSREVITLKKKLKISSYGLDLDEAVKTITELQYLSAIPEPLRVADLVASELSKGTKLLEILNEI